MTTFSPLNVQQLTSPDGRLLSYSSLVDFARYDGHDLRRLPYSLRLLLENVLRQGNQAEAEFIATWQPRAAVRPAIHLNPSRVLLQDLTGVPVITDLAAFRAAVARHGHDQPGDINPVIPVDLVIDHSIQVDSAGSVESLAINTALDLARNRVRYQFLAWAKNSFKNLRVFPPGLGVVHQVNVEYLSNGVVTRETDGVEWVFPEMVIGTDSHTTMVNGLGIVGWGVGGIEAISAMLGESIEVILPDVVGVRFRGSLPGDVTATDLALRLTELLRKRGVVDAFVEFCGPGLESLPVTDRVTLANMSPENGATMTFFPTDLQTLDYLHLTGKPTALVELVEQYCSTQGLMRNPDSVEPEYSDVVELDLASVRRSVAGPRRPQDRLDLHAVPGSFAGKDSRPHEGDGQSIAADKNKTLTDGSVVIAALTSCTNTANPHGLITAGLLAKAAVERGLKPPSWVKTSFSPGSPVVPQILNAAGLMAPLEALGFHVVGFACATCIGNSGPLNSGIEEKIAESQLTTAAVLSGNRNFEGRIHPAVKTTYLASLPLVVAYALAGTVKIDLSQDAIGTDSRGKPVYLDDLWPAKEEVDRLAAAHTRPNLFTSGYANSLAAAQPVVEPNGAEALYPWDETSTYLQEPSFLKLKPLDNHADIVGARVLAYLGDSITTDHISPAGSISPDSPAGEYLRSTGVASDQLHTYGARRGNEKVMVRGAFSNHRLRNLLLPDEEGGYTLHFPSKQRMSIYAAAQQYQKEDVPMIILAGKDYGTGSSRDWATKGPRLLGVSAVIAQSFERIHRTNLVGMGILPLQFLPGESAESLGLTGTEVYSITELDDGLTPGGTLSVEAASESGSKKQFNVTARLYSSREVSMILEGGILPLLFTERIATPPQRPAPGQANPDQIGNQSD